MSVLFLAKNLFHTFKNFNDCNRALKANEHLQRLYAKNSFRRYIVEKVNN